MKLLEDQIEELKRISPSLSIAEEGGFTYIFMKNFKLPENCTPATMDVLLLPMFKDGYNYRLFLPQIPGNIPSLNWNARNVRILGHTWNACSWAITRTDLRLIEMLSLLLKPLRK